MSPKTTAPSWEPPVQCSCQQHFCGPDVQHTASREQGGGAPAHHHQQHGERERWARTSLGERSWGAGRPRSMSGCNCAPTTRLSPLQECFCLWRRCRSWSSHPSWQFESVLHHPLPKTGTCGSEWPLLRNEAIKTAGRSCICRCSQAVDGDGYM